ncbi:MAG TPA: GNAT family N-acetyltransferase [Alkalispirochaeta sp.]|nr:GNAT family N-acetyltransferase [Alkalispirochaeta sp.]
MEWKLVARPGVSALERFLTDHEPHGVVVSEKVRTGYLDKRLRTGGRCYYAPGEAVVYHGPGGFFSPLGVSAIPHAPRRQALLAELQRAMGTFSRLYSIMGPQDDVEALEPAFRATPTHTIDYDLLALDWAHFPSQERPPHPELRYFIPEPPQWRRLLSLQTAYEVEEVLLPGRRPNLAASRATILHSLEHQVVLVATYQDTVVARVATNARGYQGDQVGGVYTDPQWRNRGVARWLMTVLLAHLQNEKRNASLFVKLDNRPAQELYRSLGFLFESPFRISYYR